MTERVLAFSTFLKLLELSDSEKLTCLKGFRRGGGFNYWRPLQILAPKVMAKKLDLGELQDAVALMAKGHRKKYNDLALTKLLKWASRRKIIVRSLLPKVIKKFGNSGLKVRIEPEVTFSMDNRKYHMHLWATNNPPLSEETLSIGLHFFRSHYISDENKDFQCLIFDTVKDRIFSEISILDSAADMLSAQREQLSKAWSELESPTSTPSGAPSSEQQDFDQPVHIH